MQRLTAHRFCFWSAGSAMAARLAASSLAACAALAAVDLSPVPEDDDAIFPRSCTPKMTSSAATHSLSAQSQFWLRAPEDCLAINVARLAILKCQSKCALISGALAMRRPHVLQAKGMPVVRETAIQG
jgi:hypothetical protein